MDKVTFRDLLRSNHTDPASLVTEADGTLRSRQPPPVPGRSTSSGLRRLSVSSETASARDFLVRQTIGEGGMGIVRRATDQRLGRHVAIKTVREDSGEADANERLIQEGRLMSSLEHPNVVPVYEVGVDAGGAPVLVMKQISGVQWTEVIQNRHHPLIEAAEDEALVFHLRIFMRICNVVSYAHDKGIIHRDIKPDNVMLGEYGEVYLLDWGIALTVKDDAPDWIPRASEVSTVAGTPGYMAPEMVTPTSRAIGTFTDVYQLGAVLHEVVTGEELHRGDAIEDQLLSAYHSTPRTYGSAVDDGLAAVIHRATAKEPDQRYASAAALRRAVGAYLTERGAEQLVRVAESRVTEARTLLENVSEGFPHVREFTALTAEAHFGFAQALQRVPHSQRAHRGLEGLQHLRLNNAILIGDLSTAESIASELQLMTAEEEYALHDLRVQKRQERQRLKDLERLQHDTDLQYGRRTRALFSLVLAVFFGVGPIVLKYGGRAGWISFSNRTLALGFIILMVAALPTLYWARTSMFGTKVNRQMVGIFGLLGFMLAVTPLAMDLVDVDPRVTMILGVAYASFTTGFLALTLEWRIAVASFIQLNGFILASVFFEYAPEIVAASSFAASLHIAMVWSPEVEIARRLAEERASALLADRGNAP